MKDSIQEGWNNGMIVDDLKAIGVACFAAYEQVNSQRNLVLLVTEHLILGKAHMVIAVCMN